MEPTREMRLGALVKKYRKAAGLTQAPVAEMLSRRLGVAITQGMVSDYEHGRRWGNLDLPGAYVHVLNIPQAEMVQAAMGSGFSPGDESTQPKTIREVIESDPTLSDAAKAHLINQYGLLQMASAAERAGHAVLQEDERPRQANG